MASAGRSVIGLTGPTGAGKSTLAAHLRSVGCAVIDCDRFARQVMDGDPDCVAAIDAAFPGCVQRGAIDRRALGAKVFADPAALAVLDSIVNPRIVAALRAEVERADKALFLDGATLIQSGAVDLCDRLLVLLAPAGTRTGRIAGRDGLTDTAAGQRVASQPDDLYYLRAADFALYNGGTPRQLCAAADALLAEILPGGCQ